MGRQVHPAVAALALLVILVTVAMIYSRRLETPAPVTASGGQMSQRGAMRRGANWTGSQSGGGSSTVVRRHVALGIEYEMTSEGPRVTAFRPAPGFAPLQAMGVEVGDVLQSCNGENDDLLARTAEAVAALQARREPIALEVSRNGKTVVLKRSEKLPEPSEDE